MTPCIYFFCCRCFNRCPVGDIIGCTGKEVSGSRCRGLLMTNPYFKKMAGHLLYQRVGWISRATGDFMAQFS